MAVPTLDIAQTIRRWMDGEPLSGDEQALLDDLQHQVAAVQLARLLVPATFTLSEHADALAA